MTYRYIFELYLLPDKETSFLNHLQSLSFKPDAVLTMNFSKYEHLLFCYVESHIEGLLFESIVPQAKDYLMAIPTDKGIFYGIPMADVFHYREIQEGEVWRTKDGTPQCKITHIKPEMISSYIFYHYQYQEEMDYSRDKYGTITMHNNLIFFYREFPLAKELPNYSCKLTTKNSPKNWAEVMAPHFEHWADGDLWKNTETFFSYSIY